MIVIVNLFSGINVIVHGESFWLDKIILLCSDSFPCINIMTVIMNHFYWIRLYYSGLILSNLLIIIFNVESFCFDKTKCPSLILLIALKFSVSSESFWLDKIKYPSLILLLPLLLIFCFESFLPAKVLLWSSVNLLGAIGLLLIPLNLLSAISLIRFFESFYNNKV